MRQGVASPSRGDLLAVAAFADRFAAPDFVAGEWHAPLRRADGTIEIGWWSPSGAVAEWSQALYDRNIIDFDSDYLGEENAEFVRRAVEDASLVAELDLPTLRRVLTFLARAERHTEGGWYEPAFASGMAQAATRRLGELADDT
jgi:hypothetical protein